MPVGARQVAGPDVVEIELDYRAIEVRAVVELHASAESEPVRLAHAVDASLGIPLRRERRHDGAVRAVGDEALVDPVVREELVRAVRVGVEAADRRKEAGLCARSNRHGL